MAARMNAAESKFSQRVADAGKKGVDEPRLKAEWTYLTSNVRPAWESLFKKIESTPTASHSSPSSPSHDHLKKALDRYRQDFEDEMRYHDMDEAVRRRCRERIRRGTIDWRAKQWMSTSDFNEDSNTVMNSGVANISST
jgi:murein L,D-transpeptidase YcbB/YkuD